MKLTASLWPRLVRTLVPELVLLWLIAAAVTVNGETTEYAEYLLDDYHHLEGLTALETHTRSVFRHEHLRTRYQQNMGYVGRELTDTVFTFGRSGLEAGPVTVGLEAGSDLTSLVRMVFSLGDSEDGSVSPYWEESTNPPSMHAKHSGDLLSVRSDQSLTQMGDVFHRPDRVHTRNRHVRGAAEFRYDDLLAVFVDLGFSSYQHVPSEYSLQEDTISRHRSRVSTTMLLKPQKLSVLERVRGVPETVEATVIDLGDLKPQGIIGSFRYDLIEPDRPSDMVLLSGGYSFFRERAFAGALLMLSGFDSERQRVFPVGVVAEWNGEYRPGTSVHTSKAFAGIDMLTLIPTYRTGPMARAQEHTDDRSAYGFSALGIEYAAMPDDIRERFANMDYVEPVRWVWNQQIHIRTPGDAIITGRSWFNLTEIYDEFFRGDRADVRDPAMVISITAGWY